jgi:hypothetical protein
MGPTSPKTQKPIAALILGIRGLKAFYRKKKKKKATTQLVLSSKDNKQASKQAGCTFEVSTFE